MHRQNIPAFVGWLMFIAIITGALLLLLGR